MSEDFVHLVPVGFCCSVGECYGVIFENMAGYFKDGNSKPPIPTVKGKLHTIVCSLIVWGYNSINLKVLQPT